MNARPARGARSAIALVFFAALFVGSQTGAASAGIATGQKGYITAFGRSYYSSSTISTSYGYALASSTIQTANGSLAPTGYMGAMARLYNGDTNALINSSPYDYSPSSFSSWGAQTGGPVTAYRNFYSYGVVKAYNGNGYNAHYTFKSPIQQS